MPQGIVIGTLLGMVLYIRFSPDDQMVAVCAGNRIYMLNTKVRTFDIKDTLFLLIFQNKIDTHVYLTMP